MIYDKINTTNAAYDADVKEAKNQTVNDKDIPSPLGNQVYLWKRIVDSNADIGVILVEIQNHGSTGQTH